jgi:hypothetical protein
MKRWNDKKLGLLALAAVMLAGGAGLVLWVLTPNRGPGQTADSSASARPSIAVSYAAFAQPKAYPCPIPGDFKSADIPVGLLCDYYEHGIEHAPPRDPSGVMQKRERFYAAPHDPVELIEADAKVNAADRVLLAELKSFGANPNGAKTLEDLVARSALKPDTLIDAARAFGWLLGDDVAAIFFTVGLSKASTDYAMVPAGDAAALPLLHAIAQTKALWRLKAWPALEQRFRLANALCAPFAAEQRRAHYLFADVLYSDRKFADAVKEIIALDHENDCARDLGVLERSDIPEMEWTIGLFLMADRRYTEALAHMDKCSRYDGEHRSDSRRLAVLALIRSGNIREAASRAKLLPVPAPRDALTNSIRNELTLGMTRHAPELFK